MLTVQATGALDQGHGCEWCVGKNGCSQDMCLDGSIDNFTHHKSHWLHEMTFLTCLTRFLHWKFSKLKQADGNIIAQCCSSATECWLGRSSGSSFIPISTVWPNCSIERKAGDQWHECESNSHTTSGGDSSHLEPSWAILSPYVEIRSAHMLKRWATYGTDSLKLLALAYWQLTRLKPAFIDAWRRQWLQKDCKTNWMWAVLKTYRFKKRKDVLTHSLYVAYAAEAFPYRVIMEDLRREITKTSFCMLSLEKEKEECQKQIEVNCQFCWSWFSCRKPEGVVSTAPRKE